MAAAVGTPAVDKTKVQLYFRAEGLLDTDTVSKSDPYLVLYTRTNISTVAQSRQTPILKTETIKDDLNPKWTKGVVVDYLFEVKQEFYVELYDDDGNGMTGDDKLGTCTFLLAHVVSSGRGTSKIAIGGGGRGFLYVSAIEVSGSKRDSVSVQFIGRDLRKMDTFGQSDPYFRLSRLNPNGTTQQIYLSKVIPNTLNPIWEPCPTFRVSDLTGADRNAKTLKFELYDKDLFSDDSMGWFEFSLNDLIEVGSGRKVFEPKKPHKPQNRYGEILCKSFNYRQVPTFLDYLKGGLQINLAVAIDFTGSNGDPRDRSSLHYMDPMVPNQYVRAIMSVGDILMEYDTDKMVPAFGFGARMPDGNVSHCFHLNFDQNPYVPGVQGILDCYGRALASVRLSGPTNFADVIRTGTHLARSSPGVYTILLIITDGEITDMQQTMDAIVAADDAPLSIVIVGVGNGCDFQMMDQLDADTTPLRNSQGRQSRRDIVQFVPFRNFVAAPQAALAAEVLAEIPDQVVDWATLAGFTVATNAPAVAGSVCGA